ncbi:MAG: hypothetical protein LBC83_03460 [Oscillospiraceae bacterium]|nr:hypothetical protein [Oscillospiraceae bacterium]
MSGDEVGLHKKIVNRGAVEFRCPVCLSAHFKIPVEELRHMIERFRKQGCTLFAPQAEKEGNRDAG